MSTCVDPEMEVLASRVGSTTHQGVSNPSAIFTFLYNNVRELSNFLPSMSDAVKEVEEAEIRVQHILDACSDPDVRDKLATLQKEFRGFIRVGKDFLENCLAMAMYATDEQHLTEIKEQLGRKMLGELKVYIDSLSGYIADCEESFDKFRTAYEEMNKRVSDAKRLFSDQREEAKKEAIDAVEKYERAVVEKKGSEVLTALCNVASKASAATGALGIIPTDVAVLVYLFSVSQTFLARTNEGPAVLDVMKQKRAFKETATNEKILQDAVHRVIDLRQSVLDAESVVKDMKSHLNRVSKIIEQRRGLQEFAESSNNDIDFHDLKNKLDQLQRAASKIVKVIGEDGITPISSKSGELTKRN